MQQPKISVIIPTFNRAEIIGQTLDSIINQTYSNWECLVIDDGSKDETEQLLKSYQQKDPRFRFLKRSDERMKGASTCRNIGIELANGDFLQFLDSDDLLGSTKFEVQIKALKTSSADAIATCKWGGMNVRGTEAKIYHGLPTYMSTKSPLKLMEVYAKNFTYFPSHVFLVPSSLISKSGKWQEDLIMNDDGEFFSRVILSSSEITFCENAYALYRSGATGRITGSQKALKKREELIRSLELIDQNIAKLKGIENHFYIRQMKAELYNKLRTENTDLLKINKDFFKNRSSQSSYFMFKILGRIRRKLNRKVEVIEFYK